MGIDAEDSLMRVWAAHHRRLAILPLLGLLLGVIAAAASRLSPDLEARLDLLWPFFSGALWLSVAVATGLGLFTGIFYRRWFPTRPGWGVVSVFVLATMGTALLAAAGLTVPLLVAGWSDLVSQAQRRVPLEVSLANLRHQAAFYASFLVLAVGAASSCGMVLVPLVRAPFLSVAGLAVTGVAALGTLASLLHVFGPVEVALAGVMGGLLAAWVGAGLAAIVGLAGGRGARLAAWVMPVGGVPISLPALLIAAWMERQPPSALATVSTIEAAPAGRWALVNGEFPVVARRQHYLVEVGGTRFFHLEGPIQNLAFTPDGTRAVWTQGGYFGSRVRGIELASGRQWSCGGLPTHAPLLDADTTRFAVATPGDVRVLEAETCRYVASLPTTDRASVGRFVGERLRVWEWRGSGTVIRELRLEDGLVEETGALEELVFSNQVSADGARLVVGRLDLGRVIDGRTGGVLVGQVSRQTARDDLLLRDGTLVSVEGGWNECPRVVATAPDGVRMALPEREAPGGPSPEGRTLEDYALEPGPGPGTVVVCGCGACDVLDPHAGTWRRLPGVRRPATTTVGWRYGENVRPPEAGTPTAGLGFDAEDQLVTFTAEGTVRPTPLP